MSTASGDDGRWLSLQICFVADDAFVRDGASHIVNVAAARDDVSGFGLVFTDDGSNSVVAAVEQEPHVGAGENASLGVGVESGANDSVLE